MTETEFQNALIQRHGQKVYDQLKAGRVAICGLGGLGSNIAISLARAGVWHLHIIDYDTVDITNLNRQQYLPEHIGTLKTKALGDQLLKINPYMDLKITNVKISEENIDQLFKDEDIVCEAFDVPETKAMLTEQMLMNHRNKILVGASGLAGYNSSNLIQTRKVTKNFYLCGDETSDIDSFGGLMAPRAMLCAAHQANMVIRLLVGETEV